MTDVVREAVLHAALWSPAPEESEWTEDQIDGFVRALDAIAPPLNAAERAHLLALLDRPHDDSVYGVLSQVVVLLESAPATGWQSQLPVKGRPWFEFLAIRWDNYLRWQGE